MKLKAISSQISSKTDEKKEGDIKKKKKSEVGKETERDKKRERARRHMLIILELKQGINYRYNKDFKK